jgi:hypothetical protein
MKIIRDLTPLVRPIPCLFVAFAVGLAVIAATRAGLADGYNAEPKFSDSGANEKGVGMSVDRIGGAQRARTFRIADDSLPPLPAPPNAAAPPPPNAPAVPSDKVTQENIFWDSVQKSNSLADYKAYLEAYPNGAFAPLARDRIAAMTPATETAQPNPTAPGSPQPAPGAPQANAPQPDENAPGPAQNAPSAEALRAEVGTAETEQALNLNRRDARVLQERLAAQGLYSGPIDGDLGPGSRAAIAAWQQSHGMAPTGFLGPVLLGALQSEIGPVNGERVNVQGCPPGFHVGRYGRRCWADR